MGYWTDLLSSENDWDLLGHLQDVLFIFIYHLNMKMQLLHLSKKNKSAASGTAQRPRGRRAAGLKTKIIQCEHFSIKCAARDVRESDRS